ncbi:hypothetical protein ASPNIDRAFT_121899 [Aspergillus niger ATCC 1015]|uniref:Aminoglycoside phosphotransferase domain-containing protein n=1 Tax=Aspergillus niger (strain ATCC 1015 / CBS 113.46 / FGSC A1144 / LSHB Ac4 / NCTC 3858a / NRRL 328 / USDA 3528.7) TaxID=380704 RepID=G3XX54_ASPNA|nr:hypothetical protein ASPNIDRAFT_121899 [Aspergillus niger ATCC 1015]
MISSCSSRIRKSFCSSRRPRILHPRSLGHLQPVRALTTTECARQSTVASHGDLFRYTSGRWLVNEHLRLSERFLEFDVLALQSIVSTASGHSVSELRSFTNLSEGGYNPPEHYAVASEAATLDYLRLHGLHAPEDQYKIMTQIVDVETRLMSLKFPASGSLYYLKDLPSEKRTRLDDPNSMEFCIGPIAHYSWWHDERGIMDIDRGPYLVNYLKVVPSLDHTNKLSLDRPVMRHPDLQPNNILVSDKNDIIGLSVILRQRLFKSAEYPEDVVRETFDLDMQQKEADVAMEQMRHALGVDVLGWVPNEGYEAARRLACDMKVQMLEAAETPDEVIAIRDHFPFDDFDERG